ncbi:hypothetical protein ACOBV9_22500 (plasmid) [Pseudoalteromonas espejiana]
MPDHLHWLFQLKDASLSDVIKHYKWYDYRWVKPT